MRLQVSKTKNAASFYMVESIWENGKHSSRVVEKLGTYEELKRKLGDIDPYEWAKAYVAKKTEEKKAGREPEIVARYNPNRQLKQNERRTYSGGYLFLQEIYYSLGLNKICSKIKKQYKFDFDLNAILSRLLYGRILFPRSKLSTYELSENLIEKPGFALHQVYRALEVIAKETDTLQAELYKHSLKACKRDTSVLYYDCTNYFFEIEEAEGLKQYGVSKEHRPNPIVEMGLFMDGSGLPLAFSIHSGNENEQKTMKPLERMILDDFKLSRFVVCTDAGLSSEENRRFNNIADRGYVTVQSIKKLKAHLKEWALAADGWMLVGKDDDNQRYDISELDEAVYEDATFYKERWINENNLEQRLIVTYSIKHRNYQRYVRAKQIERAIKAIGTNADKHRQTDYKRFLQRVSVTGEGEVATRDAYTLNEELIEQEAAFDGFYAVCTNLTDDANAINAINKRRWEIEESFRILKYHLKARPVYLKRDDRIQAHFTTCFLALMLYRVLEKRLSEKYTCEDIIQCLQSINFLKVTDGYIPLHTRTELADALCDASGIQINAEIITNKQMKLNIRRSKS